MMREFFPKTTCTKLFLTRETVNRYFVHDFTAHFTVRHQTIFTQSIVRELDSLTKKPTEKICVASLAIIFCLMIYNNTLKVSRSFNFVKYYWSRVLK